MFKSRRISPEQFSKEFFDTLTPGVIPREQFIDWGQIKEKCQEYADVMDYFAGVSALERPHLEKEISGSLLSSDDPHHLLKGAFELLGHTNDYYVSDKDNLEFHEIANQIESGSEKAAEKCAIVILDLGLRNVLATGEIGSAFLGVQVGLESNRRKSVGGGVFNQWAKRLIESTCSLLGSEYAVTSEEIIHYKDVGSSKRVDFAIAHRGRIKIGVEVNFYTTSGSKPSEIKRAYADVNRELNKVGVELLWITDGAGYLKMKRGIEEAFKAHPNTYNYDMACRHLKADILDFLKS